MTAQAMTGHRYLLAGGNSGAGSEPVAVSKCRSRGDEIDSIGRPARLIDDMIAMLEQVARGAAARKSGGNESCDLVARAFRRAQPVPVVVHVDDLIDRETVVDDVADVSEPEIAIKQAFGATECQDQRSRTAARIGLAAEQRRRESGCRIRDIVNNGPARDECSCLREGHRSPTFGGAVAGKQELHIAVGIGGVKNRKVCVAGFAQRSKICNTSSC
ncbi:MAG: hypothetical protein J0L91_00835 [Burkholderiales bacterium]|nr:hypothetical protein [Burkholderiales bacterium]